MFDASFYQNVLPGWVRTQCEARPQQIPVVELRLADATTLDICHIVHLADRWLSVAYFRDSAVCADMDLAFIGYEMVTRVTLSLHDPKARRLGFSVAKSEEATAPGTPGRT